MPVTVLSVRATATRLYVVFAEPFSWGSLEGNRALRTLLLHVSNRDDYAGYGSGTSSIELHCNGAGTAIKTREALQSEIDRCALTPMNPTLSGAQISVVQKSGELKPVSCRDQWSREIAGQDSVYTVVSCDLAVAYPLTIKDRDDLAERRITLYRKNGMLYCACASLFGKNTDPWSEFIRMMQCISSVLSA